MVTLLDTLTAMLTKAGVALDSPEAKEFITANSDLANKPAPEVVTNSLNGLMSLAGARANSEVRDHYISELLNPLDKELVKQAEDLLSPEELAAFKATKSTYKKASLISEAQVNAIKEAKKAATKAGDTDAVKVLNEQLAEANRKLQETEATFTQKLEAERNERENFIFNHEFERNLSAYQLNPLLAADPDRFQFLRTKFDRALNEAGAIMKRTDKGIELFQADSPTTPYYDKTKNTAVAFKEFSEKILSNYVATAQTEEKQEERRTYTGDTTKNGQAPKSFAEKQAAVA